MRYKKAQSAMEFLILFLFIMLILTFVTTFVGDASVDLSDQQVKDSIDNFAESILAEFITLQEVEGGYERTFTIEKHFIDRFDVEFNQSILIVRDYDSYGLDSDIYIYDIPGEYNLSSLVDADGDMQVTISRVHHEDYIGIELI